MGVSARIDRPDGSEYASFYAKYIALVPDGDLVATLETQDQEFRAFVAGLPAEKADFAYAPGKWTVKQMLRHIADAERVFCYRMLSFSRGDQTELPGFDENTWAQHSAVAERSLAELSQELSAVRGATLAMLRNLPVEAPTRRGTANGAEITVRALAWIIAGHQRHHLKILKERYL